MSFQTDAHALRETIDKAVKQFHRKHSGHQVRSITPDYSNGEPVTDINIRPVEVETYKSKAGVTVPLASRKVTPPVATEEN